MEYSYDQELYIFEFVDSCTYIVLFIRCTAPLYYSSSFMDNGIGNWQYKFSTMRRRTA